MKRSNQAMQLTGLRLVFPLSVATTFFLQPSRLSIVMADLMSLLGGEVKLWLLLTRQFELGGYMSRTMLFIAMISFLGCLTTPSSAQDSRWGSPDDPIVKFIIAVEAKWASSSCSPQPDLKAVIADDFQGTATNGHRYDKAEAIATDPKALERDCQLGDVKVRFFGDSIAIAYGAESRIRKAEDGKEARRCQVWTDTWLKRNGQWQIVAAQDTVIPCP